LSAIGDTCHTVPVVRAIQRSWPDTRITWIIGAVEHSLMKGLEGVDFAVLDKRDGWLGYSKLRRQLSGRQFPLLLHMHASVRAGIASRMVDASMRLGFDRARARDYQWLFCNRQIPARPRRHVMDGLFEFATALGIDDIEPHWNIPVSAQDRQLAEHTIAAEQPCLIISPCTGQRFRNYRNWAIERYAEVADHAHTRYGAKVVLTGGNSAIERQYGEGIVSATNCTPTNLIGKTSLKELFALIQRCSVVLCPDSGPAHMATAAGTPVVGLYATSNRHRTGPYFSQHLVADRYPEAVDAEFGTRVDEIRFGRRVRNPDAMNLISVPEVLERIEAAFEEGDIRPRVGS
jgi:heptosyltransferase I